MDTVETRPETIPSRYTYTNRRHKPIDLIALGLFCRSEVASFDPWEDRLTVEQYAMGAMKRGIPTQEIRELFGDVIQGPLTEAHSAALETRLQGTHQPLGQLTLQTVGK